ncbi:LacI family transcriptional regulator [Klebsiella aerogenes]|nr:LacI family transcriptional regulator [Klebsiella aerogenes]
MPACSLTDKLANSYRSAEISAQQKTEGLSMANIRDVARRAGVSISSVSNVLNNRTQQMREETRQRIVKTMAELNYRPARCAPPVADSATKMLGLMVPSIVNPSFSALAHELDTAARAFRHRLLLGICCRDAAEESAFIADMFSHGVRGLIVAASDVRKTHFVRAAEQGMTIISYDNRLAESVPPRARYFDSVSMDNVEAGRLAAQHLLDNGCRNIVFATESGLTLGRSHKILGFQSALCQSGTAARGVVIEGKGNREFGDAEMFELGVSLAQKISALTPRVDGVVAINDALAIGLMVGLRAQGLKIAEDISVIGIDNISLSALSSPGLTSVMAPLSAMASMMVERLVQRIAEPGLQTDEFIFAPEVIQRQSVKIKQP